MMTLEDQKPYELSSSSLHEEHSNVAANYNSKADACELSVSIYLSMLRTKRNLVRGGFD